MIDASQIYSQIKAYASLEDQAFCNLHKCVEPDKCDSPQHHKMLDFDKVKDTYCKEKGIQSCKSADGLSYNDNGVLFVVEIKGWELYKRYRNPKTEQEVKNKVEKYGLPAKLSDSLMICRDILSKTEMSVVLPVVYLVVSDIKKGEAVEEIEANLWLLSETSSDFSQIYGKEIESQLSKIPEDIDYGFVADCRDIDHEIDSWESVRKVPLLEV